MTPRLDPPVAVDLVPAEHVRDIITRTDVELTELERSAAELFRAVEHAEQAVSEAGLDPESSAWTMVRLQRFLDGLRDETQREVETMLELARQQARMRLAENGVPQQNGHGVAATGATAATAPAPVESRIEAPLSSPSPARSVIPPTATSAPPVAPSPAAAAAAPVVQPAAPVEQPPTVVPARAAPAEPTAQLSWAAPGAAAAAAAAHSVAAPEAELPAAAIREETTPHLTLVSPPAVDEPTPAPAAPVVPEQTRPAPQPAATAVIAAPAAATAPPPAPAPTPTPPAVQPTAKRGFLRRLPISAILEVIAVLLILVFILLRLS